jgi:hypothetical protein
VGQTKASAPEERAAAAKIGATLGLAVLAGLVGFSAGVAGVNFAPFFFFPILWFLSPGRVSAYIVASSFYLLASWGIIGSAPVFFELGAGFQTARYLLLLWCGTALSLSLPWCVLWTRPDSSVYSKFIRLLVISAVLSVPPLGLWGWGNPLLSAGYILPYTREAGIALVLVAWTALWHCLGKKRAVFRAALALVFVYIAFMSPEARLEVKTPENWRGINTRFGKLFSGSDDSIGAYFRYQALSVVLARTTERYIVLPETIAGWWGKTTENLWSETTGAFALKGRTLFIGAETSKRGTKKYYNVVQVRGGANATVEQRYPVPFSMWNPFSETGTIANWFGGNGTVEVDGKSVGVLICFEAYIYFPSLVTMVSRPDVLVAVSNVWWAKTTNIPLLLDKCVKSWALLFDTPVVTSKNT